MRRIHANGIDLVVAEWPHEGDARGVAVLLHGFQDASSSFDLVAPRLASIGFDVAAPDLRGFGDSDRVGAGGYYHFADYVFDVADLIDALSPGAPVYLIGHSMGGVVATLYAGTFPERVALLAILEGFGPPEVDDAISPDRFRHWIDGVRKTRTRAERSMSIDEAIDRLSQNHMRVERSILERRARQLTREVSPGRFLWRFDPLHRTTSPVGFSLARWRAHASRVTAPTLVVGGGPSGFHHPDEGDRIAAFAHARVAEIGDAGHMMHWTRPNELVELLTRFADG